MKNRTKFLMSVLVGLILISVFLIYPPKEAEAYTCPGDCWPGWQDRVDGAAVCPQWGIEKCCFSCDDSNE